MQVSKRHPVMADTYPPTCRWVNRKLAKLQSVWRIYLASSCMQPFCVCVAGCAQAQSLATSLAGPGATLLNSSSYAYGPGTPLFAYPVGFPLVTCNASVANPTQSVNVSVSERSLLPASRADATSPYPAVQTTVRVSWPNNVTGECHVYARMPVCSICSHLHNKGLH